jgi:hypothetical protein
MNSNKLKEEFLLKKISNENHLNCFFPSSRNKANKTIHIIFCGFFSHPTPAKSFAFELLSSMSNNPFKFWANPAIFANR